MEESGCVKEVEGGRIVVEIERKSACSRCGLCSISSATGRMLIELENDILAVKGDKLKLTLPGKTVLQASFTVFVLPLIFFFAGILLGYKFSGNNQGVAALAGLTGLAAGFLVAKIVEIRARKTGFINIKAEKIL